MNKSTSEITLKLAMEFEPVARRMMEEGADQVDIDRALKNFLGLKARHNFAEVHQSMPRAARNLGCLMRNMMHDAGWNVAKEHGHDSMTEVVLYNKLRDAGVRFSFQRDIGKYRVDFLIGSLVVEVDGPCHNERLQDDAIRDGCLRKLGYTIMRIPASLVAVDPESVVRAIQKNL